MAVFSRSTGKLFPTAIRVLAVVIGIVCFFGVIQGVLFAVIPFVFSVVAFFLNQGCEVDTTNRYYRFYWGIFSFKSGKWYKLPTPDKLTITTEKQVFSNNLPMGGAQAYSSSITFNLNIKISNRERITAASGPYKTVLKDAEHLAELLQLDILDCSTREKRLIKHEELNQGFQQA